jgi:hypothetical protein
MCRTTRTPNGDSPVDSDVLPPPETVESGSIREAFPRTGELSAREANDEVAPNGDDGVVPAAEIPFHPLVNLLPIPDEARVGEMAREMGEHGHERGQYGDRSGGTTADAPGTSQPAKRRSWWL